MDTFSEFLTENEQRRYPFVEDSSLQGSGGFILPDSVVLDARGFSRERPDVAPQLAALIGPSGASTLDLVPVAGCYNLFFTMGRQESPLFLGIQVSVITQWPFMGQAIIQDPNYPARDVRLASLRVTIGQGILSLAPDISVSFSGTAVLEPALVASLYRTQVDFLKVIHSSGPNQFIGSKVVLVGGYNIDALPTSSGIQLNASPGAGTLGSFVGSLAAPADSACAGRITSLNMIQPDKNGQAWLKGQNGITVVDVPEQNLIQLQLTSESLGGNFCV